MPKTEIQAQPETQSQPETDFLITDWTIISTQHQPDRVLGKVNGQPFSMALKPNFNPDLIHHNGQTYRLEPKLLGEK